MRVLSSCVFDSRIPCGLNYIHQNSPKISFFVFFGLIDYHGFDSELWLLKPYDSDSSANKKKIVFVKRSSGQKITRSMISNISSHSSNHTKKKEKKDR